MINTNHSYFEKITSQPKEVYFCISKEFWVKSQMKKFDSTSVTTCKVLN
jgi:hypothetical protein